MKRLSIWGWPLWWPLAVGLLSLAVTAWLWQHEQQTQQRHLRDNFDFGLRQTTTRIEQRLVSYEQMLRGVRGLFEASDEITAADFAGYVDALLAGADFAGLRNIAYAPLLGGDGPAPVVHVAPAAEGGLNPPGRDLWADPGSRSAMLQARNSGRVAITRRLRPPDGAADEAGFLMFMPLYQRGRSVATAVERQAHGAGWVMASFRLGDLMSSLYGEDTPGMAVSIHDGVELSARTLIHPAAPSAASSAVAAAPARFVAHEFLGFAGQTWTVVARSGPAFEQRYANDSALIIAVAGLGLSGVLSLLAWLLVTGRERAHQSARLMTQELRSSAERYRRIVETANEGIWTVDAAGRTSFANPKLQQLLGYREAEMLGRPWSDFVADELADARARAADGLLPPTPPELRLRRSDGGELWALLSTSRITDTGGHHAGVLAMVTDISERHQAEARRAALEAQLRQSQKMEAIGTLAGGIAHDFNNVLAAILGNVALLRQSAAGHDGDAALRLEQIGKAASRARSLVHQIVAFSRQQPQQLQVQPLEPLLQETLALLRSTMPAGVELVSRLPGTPVLVDADATQLQQVLMNLCTNAWHALPGGAGRIEVGFDAVLLDAEAAANVGAPEPGPYAHLWVADSGRGMDEPTRQRVFEPFFTTKPVGQGTGLGLAVVHGIVRSHRGAIAVSSTQGQGSRFEIWLPLAAAAPAPASDPAAAVPAGHGQCLLYVDDDAVVGVMVQALLQGLGYRVRHLADPREALAVLRDPGQACELLITDYNMPEFSGLDLAREACRLRPGLPVLLSSGYVSDSLRAEARAAGVRHVLQKEYTLDRLGALVHEVLGEHGAG